MPYAAAPRGAQGRARWVAAQCGPIDAQTAERLVQDIATPPIAGAALGINRASGDGGRVGEKARWLATARARLFPTIDPGRPAHSLSPEAHAIAQDEKTTEVAVVWTGVDYAAVPAFGGPSDSRLNAVPMRQRSIECPSASCASVPMP